MPKKDTAPHTPREPLAPTVDAPLEDSTPRGHERHVANGALRSFTITVETPNVIWRGPGEPPPFVNAGHKHVALPDADAQRAGFYSDDAALLTESVVGYKHFIASDDAKGGE